MLVMNPKIKNMYTELVGRLTLDKSMLLLSSSRY